MEKEVLFGILESVLFAMGSPVEISKLAEVLEMEEDELQTVVSEFITAFEQSSRGMKVIRLNNTIQMISRSEYHSYIAKMLETKSQRNLTQSALETLSIIAYNQPVTKAMVDSVRGVDSYNSIIRLLERELIEQRGRMDTIGRPMLYGTTNEFLRVFGLESLNDLPKLDLKTMENIGHTDNLTFADLTPAEEDEVTDGEEVAEL